MEQRKINILGYPTNKASSGGFSAKTPIAFEKIIHPHFKGKYGVQDEFEMVRVNDKTSARKNEINNYDSIYESVQNLCIAQAKKLWNGEVPITIGGDHSQGFPTVKSSLFVSVLKELTSDNSKSLDDENKNKLKSLADKGDFVEASKLLNSIIDNNYTLQVEVGSIVSNTHVIWVDAHGDFNTKLTSGSGNFHGMSLAAACGLDTGGIEEVFGKYIRANSNNVHIMCARDLDDEEERLMKRFGVDFERFEMHDVDKGKIRSQGESRSKNTKTFDKAFLELVNEIKNDDGKIILSTDIDHLPVPETGTPLGSKEHVRKNRFDKSPPGPSPEDTYWAYQNIAHDPAFIAFDLTEVALGYPNKDGKFIFGVKACVAGINILASMVGGDEARREIFSSLKKEGGFKERLKIVAESYSKEQKGGVTLPKP